MLKMIATAAALALALGLAAARAQTTPQDAVGDAAAAAPTTDDTPPPATDAPAQPNTAPAAAAPDPKKMITDCRDTAIAKGLKGDARWSSVHACVAAQSPQIALRMDCNRQAWAKHLADKDHRAFVRDCVAKAKT